MVRPSSSTRHCLECGMPLPSAVGRCWLCGQPAQTRSVARAWVDKDSRLQFRLDSLLLTVTLLCGCFSLARVAPRATIAMVVIFAPAYLRTALRVREWGGGGWRVSVPQKIGWFTTSSVVMTAIVAAGGTVAVLVTAGGAGIGWLIEWWYEQDLLGVLWFVLGAAGGLFLGLAAMVWAATRLWMWPAPPGRTWGE